MHTPVIVSFFFGALLFIFIFFEFLFVFDLKSNIKKLCHSAKTWNIEFSNKKKNKYYTQMEIENFPFFQGAILRPILRSKRLYEFFFLVLPFFTFARRYVILSHK